MLANNQTDSGDEQVLANNQTDSGDEQVLATPNRVSHVVCGHVLGSRRTGATLPFPATTFHA